MSQQFYLQQYHHQIIRSRAHNGNSTAQTTVYATNPKTMQPKLSLIFTITTLLIPFIVALTKECPVCFDNTVRGCDGIGPGSRYYTCYQTPAAVHMVSTYTCDGGCRLVNGEPRCNNGKFHDDTIAMPMDPKCPWGLRGMNGNKPSRFRA